MKTIISLLFIVSSFNTFSQNVNPDSLKSWMYWLSADERKGRANGSEVNVAVAEWLIARFGSFGAMIVPGQSTGYQDYKSTINKLLTNIICYIPGKTDNLIVLSAHYDHIGLDPVNDKDPVFNGADDNASGICMLLGIASEILSDPVKPECSIVIAAFSGEELGLQGSAFFCQSEFIPWDKVKLNLNFELCGRSEELGSNNFYITGPSNSSLARLVQKYNQGGLWHLTDVGQVSDMLYQMADNYSFIRYRNGKKVCLPAHTIAIRL